MNSLRVQAAPSRHALHGRPCPQAIRISARYDHSYRLMSVVPDGSASLPQVRIYSFHPIEG